MAFGELAPPSFIRFLKGKANLSQKTEHSLIQNTQLPVNNHGIFIRFAVTHYAYTLSQGTDRK